MSVPVGGTEQPALGAVAPAADNVIPFTPHPADLSRAVDAVPRRVRAAG